MTALAIYSILLGGILFGLSTYCYVKTNEKKQLIKKDNDNMIDNLNETYIDIIKRLSK